jgi:hypothetical protein
MKRPMQRMSQIVLTFGPGAMIDLPTRSVVIAGLDRWEMDAKDSWKPLSEPRLVERLSRLVFEGGPSNSGHRPPIPVRRAGPRAACR